MTITAKEAISDWEKTKLALVAASNNQAAAQKAHDEAKLITEAVASAVLTKHTTLRMLRTVLRDDVRDLGNNLSRIESDMSRAADDQERRGAIYGDHPLPGLEKRHDEVTKAREARKYEVAALDQALGE